MLKITHHSGRPRWLNYERVEDVDMDEQGRTVITMSSGRTHVACEAPASIIAAMDAWYKTELPALPAKMAADVWSKGNK